MCLRKSRLPPKAGIMFSLFSYLCEMLFDRPNLVNVPGYNNDVLKCIHNKEAVLIEMSRCITLY